MSFSTTRLEQTIKPDGQLTVGSITLSYERHSVIGPAGEVDLTNRDLKLLEAFMLHPGRAQSRDDLMYVVWGLSTFVEDRNIDASLCYLRRKLKKAGAPADFIKPVWGVGYKLNDQASQQEAFSQEATA